MTYTNSPFVDYIKLSPNHSGQRNHIIDTVTIHCVVGQVTVERLGEIFASPTKGGSCNYGIGSDGRIALIVEEKNRSWCTDSRSNDHRAITIEVASDTTHPYAVNDKAYASLIKLLADICKRNNIKQLLWQGDKNLIGQPDKQNMTVHRWFANKSCPGDYLYNLHGTIAKEVNEMLSGWQKDDKGWWYRHTDGSYTTNGWEKIGEEWFYFDNEGYALKANTWAKLNDKWYYFNERNAAVKGYQTIDGALYYFAEISTDVISECQLIVTNPGGVVLPVVSQG